MSGGSVMPSFSITVLIYLSEGLVIIVSDLPI